MPQLKWLTVLWVFGVRLIGFASRCLFFFLSRYRPRLNREVSPLCCAVVVTLRQRDLVLLYVRQQKFFSRQLALDAKVLSSINGATRSNWIRGREASLLDRALSACGGTCDRRFVLHSNAGADSLADDDDRRHGRRRSRQSSEMNRRRILLLWLMLQSMMRPMAKSFISLLCITKVSRFRRYRRPLPRGMLRAKITVFSLEVIVESANHRSSAAELVWGCQVRLREVRDEVVRYSRDEGTVPERCVLVVKRVIGPAFNFCISVNGSNSGSLPVDPFGCARPSSRSRAYFRRKS